MVQKVAIGIQDFNEIVERNVFYVDKTDFIKSWWDSGDDITLITRPRRFGKTLTMSMLNCFFSIQYADRGDLFQNLNIWKYEEYRQLQGTYPVIFLSFADVQDEDIEGSLQGIKEHILDQYSSYYYLQDSPLLTEIDKKQFRLVQPEMEGRTAISAIKLLSKCLYQYYQKKVIILIDEYDTPMITAYSEGYWKKMAKFMRSFLNATFKTNPYLARGIMTGITRTAKESIFSGLNNLKVISTTSKEYADTFGFTEEEVFAAMDERGKTEEEKQEVKRYYDGFTFGNKKGIYNPWSIINYFDDGRILPYWANTASNELITKVIKEGQESLRLDMVSLLNGETIQRKVNEFIVFSDLKEDDVAYSLLVSAGYLRIDSQEGELYSLSITNYETKIVFRDSIHRIIENGRNIYGKFATALISGNIDDINDSIQEFAETSFSFYDKHKKKPECFYHGFVLGLIAELFETYHILSNRESGNGRSDVSLYRRDLQGDAIILEFKAINKKSEKSLSDTVNAALKQLDEKKYSVDLKEKGYDDSRIRKYGFAFNKKEVLVGRN